MNNIKLFASCIPVKGAKRSIIYDLQRMDYDFIPNSLYEFLKAYDGKSLTEVKELYSDEENLIIDEYISFLVNKDYIFLTDQPESYPDLNLDWDAPRIITNSIIDFDAFSCHNFNEIIAQLTRLRCQALELRFFDNCSLNKIKELLEVTNDTTIRSISLVIKYDESITPSEIDDLMTQRTALKSLVIHGCATPIPNLSNKKVACISNLITDESHCGVIDHLNFSVNISLFTESVHHNSCLNRKVSIDKNGEIKNCPSSLVSFGNIKYKTLLEAINSEGFKDLWNIKKDNILVCKDCEFRYMCTDCRVYLSDNDNIYSKPLKCNYDPYN